LLFESDKYEKPFAEFLNKFAARHRRPSASFLKNCRREFEVTISAVYSAVGGKAFRPGGSLNAAVFDSVMVGVARRLDKGRIKKPSSLLTAYQRLLRKESYAAATSRATSDEASVTSRLREATNAFKNVE
jgi:hypothetical protein